MTTDAIYEERGSDWSQQVSVVATTQWLQHDQTLSLQRVWLASLAASHVIMQPHPLSLHATANGAHELDAPPEQGEHNAAVGGIPS